MPRMKLKSYIEWQGITQGEFAERARISEGHLSLIIHNKRRPRPGIAERISKATDGHVTELELLYPDRR
jgi:transcriptional regulator with XRE-family HTH domain